MKCPIFFQNYVLEQSLSYTPTIISEDKNLYLDGYWQCEKYFLHNQDIIHQEFQVTTPQSDVNKKWADIIANTNSVCIHVMRGDYVTDPGANQVHGTRGSDYYNNAITYLLDKVDSPVFFVFSDDLEWTKENISIPSEVHYMDQNGPDEDYEDLRLMMSCKHFIIANSSFSWWGAWLGNFEDKIIIAPKKWFNEPNVKDDIVPDSWIRL